VDHVSGKFKFAQNKSKEDRQKIISRLTEKGSPADLFIAGEVRKTLQ
jgi:predicted FMN-binding regulatory protein PaiB